MGQKQSGKLPAEGLIVLESLPEQWTLFARGLINQFSTPGVIEFDNKKVRVEIEVKMVFSPDRNIYISQIQGFQSNFLDKEKSNGARRASQFFYNLIDKKTWLIIGYIKGKNQIPVVINHYELLNLSVYAQKLLGEENNDFSPYPFPFSAN